MRVLSLITLIGLLTLVAVGCDSESPSPEPTDTFDRKVMLTQWADDFIIPSWTVYVSSLGELEESVSNFKTEKSAESLAIVRSHWKKAYLDWQKVSMYDIGKAESLGIRNTSNIYPADVTSIEQHLKSGLPNFDLPSTFTAQGFPTIEYLIYGDNLSDEEVIAKLTGTHHGLHYLGTLVALLKNKSTEVLNDWQSTYRAEFIDRSGSSATSSVNKLANDFLFYYEKFLRAGKVGIPAGVFSNTTLPENVEARFAPDFSQELFLTALDATQAFFNGGDPNSNKSFAGYLNHLGDDNSLVSGINQQFDLARAKALTLDENFKSQVSNNNTAMLELYDILQKNVVYMKVDMFQKLNIKVDYVDADGD